MAANRAQDQRLLEMVRARAAGATIRGMEERFGVPGSGITTRTNKVMDADLAHSTEEKPTTIKAAYWPRRE